MYDVLTQNVAQERQITPTMRAIININNFKNKCCDVTDLCSYMTPGRYMEVPIGFVHAQMYVGNANDAYVMRLKIPRYK